MLQQASIVSIVNDFAVSNTFLLFHLMIINIINICNSLWSMHYFVIGLWQPFITRISIMIDCALWPLQIRDIWLDK